ncbi:MAG: hypothetical protein AAB625_00825 [Patescibacteria group bacterium]
MPKVILKHSHFHWIHLVAVFILGGYFVLSKVNTVNAILKENPIETFLQLYLFGTFFACLFLYIFSHEKFFPFAKDIEKQEQRNENKYLKKYFHHGKILGTFLIGAIGGPIFSSLTARILLNNFRFKYLIIILANIPSTLFTLGVGWGILRFV